VLQYVNEQAFAQGSPYRKCCYLSFNNKFEWYLSFTIRDYGYGNNLFGSYA